MARKVSMKPAADMVPGNLTKEKAQVTDTQHVVTDPPLPAGITQPNAPTIDSPQVPNGENETQEPDVADVPIGQRSNKIAQNIGTYYDKARMLGSTKIIGDNSLIALAEACIDGGRKGVFVQEKDGPDYAKEMYQRFSNPNSGLRKTKYADPTEPVNEASFTQQVNKLNWFIQLGWHRGDQGYAFFHDVKRIHEEMAAKKEDRTTLKYRARYEGILSVVRPYMSDWIDDQATVMPDEDEIRNLLRKEDSTPVDAIGLMLRAFKDTQSAFEGKKADAKTGKPERKPVKDDRLTTVMETLRDVINDQGPDAAKRYLDATATKKKLGKKKGNGQTDPNAGVATDDQGNPLPDAPVGSEGPDSSVAVK